MYVSYRLMHIYTQQEEHMSLLTYNCILCNFSMVLNIGSHAAASLPGGTRTLNICYFVELFILIIKSILNYYFTIYSVSEQPT